MTQLHKSYCFSKYEPEYPVILNKIYRSCSLHIALLVSLNAWRENRLLLSLERLTILYIQWDGQDFSRGTQNFHNPPANLPGKSQMLKLFHFFCSYRFA